jgi:hypothetical protein
MRSLLRFAGFLLMTAFPLFAQTATTNHLEILKKSTWFATTGGFANATTPEGYAVTAICRQTNAVATFRSLLQEQGSAQQLYGLLGLRLVNTPEFKDALPRFLQSKAKVRVLVGCIAGEWEVSKVAKQVQAGQWNPRLVPVPGGEYAPAP